MRYNTIWRCASDDDCKLTTKGEETMGKNIPQFFDARWDCFSFALDGGGREMVRCAAWRHGAVVHERSLE